MQRVIELRRQCTKFAIDEHPTEITINRVTTTPKDNGGKTETKSTIGPLKVRIYEKPRAKQITDDGGSKRVQSQWWMLAEWDADIRHDQNNTDTFEVDGKHYTVIGVAKYGHGGEVTSIQAELEAV